jgi:NAD(P)-dependent dehydrogenase (short-subunit alcohol dehydrogenase family)
MTIAADLAEAGDVDRAVDAALEEFETIDILVNNARAGGATDMPVLEIPDDALDLTYRTNVLAPFRLTRALAKSMVSSGRGGCVINVLSGAGFLPLEASLPYGTTKAALWMMTRYFAVELAPAVRVNALVPGSIAEKGAPRNEVERAFVETSVPFKRMGRPNEVAGAAVYLASPAATYTSGTVLFCNGARPW